MWVIDWKLSPGFALLIFNLVAIVAFCDTKLLSSDNTQLGYPTYTSYHQTTQTTQYQNTQAPDTNYQNTSYQNTPGPNTGYQNAIEINSTYQNTPDINTSYQNSEETNTSYGTPAEANPSPSYCTLLAATTPGCFLPPKSPVCLLPPSSPVCMLPDRSRGRPWPSFLPSIQSILEVTGRIPPNAFNEAFDKDAEKGNKNQSKVTTINIDESHPQSDKTHQSHKSFNETLDDTEGRPASVDVGSKANLRIDPASLENISNLNHSQAFKNASSLDGKKDNYSENESSQETESNQDTAKQTEINFGTTLSSASPTYLTSSTSTTDSSITSSSHKFATPSSGPAKRIRSSGASGAGGSVPVSRGGKPHGGGGCAGKPHADKRRVIIKKLMQKRKKMMQTLGESQARTTKEKY